MPSISLPALASIVAAAAGTGELGLGISNAVSGPPKPPPVETIPGSPTTVVSSPAASPLPTVANQIMGAGSPTAGAITAPTASVASPVAASILGGGGTGGASVGGGGKSATPPNIGGDINQDQPPPWLPSATNAAIAPGTPEGAS